MLRELRGPAPLPHRTLPPCCSCGTPMVWPGLSVAWPGTVARGHRYALTPPPGASAGIFVVVLSVVFAAAPANGLAQRISFEQARRQMVDKEIVDAGIKNERVVAAIGKTPRHEFVPRSQRRFAYLDMALPIGYSQTISPPFVVAYMTEQIDPQPGDRVLEIGTGSGYQAAVLAELVDEVYTIEIVEPLGKQAERTLKRLQYENVYTAIGDGYQGWPRAAPFDKIIVTCSPDDVPAPLADQLKEGGLMIIPLGERYRQFLVLLEKKEGKLVEKALLPTLFVPMTGQAELLRRDEPDPSNPEIINGGFEEFTQDDEGSPHPAGWHYQRQLTLETAGAPQGSHYVTFRNQDPGRYSQALQGFAIDGGAVYALDVSVWVKWSDVKPATEKSFLPELGINFYDDVRRPAGFVKLGPWEGTRDWTVVTGQVEVPRNAHEAVVHIGLLGGTGEISFDAIEIKPLLRKRPR